ncbi:MAG: hypothetical protein R6U20_11295 [Longimonas sp.]|uniref:hypothetical protein n=1 Tax=Longimonas sp. TaxID=2039626 RepID=UPI003974D0AD
MLSTSTSESSAANARDWAFQTLRKSKETEERKELFEDLTLEEVVAEIRKEKKTDA